MITMLNLGVNARSLFYFLWHKHRLGQYIQVGIDQFDGSRCARPNDTTHQYSFNLDRSQALLSVYDV